MTGIDLNRAGTPLLEIVSEPDMRSAAEAVAYAQDAARARDVDRHLRRQHAGRQLPLRRQRVGAPAGRAKLGTRCEIKNLNSFRFLQQAIEFEVRRQIELIEDGGTRRAGDAALRSRPRRDAVDAQQGRRAGLPLLPRSRPAAAGRSTTAWIERVRAEMPELPEAMRDASRARVRLADYDAAQLTASRELGGYFEDGACPRRRTHAQARRATGCWASCRRRSIASDVDIARGAGAAGRARRPAAARRRRHDVRQDGASDVFDAMWAGERRRRRDHRRARACARSPTRARSRRWSTTCIAANPAIVAEFRAGKEKAFNALVGKAMQASKGKAESGGSQRGAAGAGLRARLARTPAASVDARTLAFRTASPRGRRGDRRRAARSRAVAPDVPPPRRRHRRRPSSHLPHRRTCAACARTGRRRRARPRIALRRGIRRSSTTAKRRNASTPTGLTMAHRTLPFGTRVRVTNLANHRSVGGDRQRSRARRRGAHCRSVAGCRPANRHGRARRHRRDPASRPPQRAVPPCTDGSLTASSCRSDREDQRPRQAVRARMPRTTSSATRVRGIGARSIVEGESDPERAQASPRISMLAASAPTRCAVTIRPNHAARTAVDQHTAGPAVGARSSDRRWPLWRVSGTSAIAARCA